MLFVQPSSSYCCMNYILVAEKFLLSAGVAHLEYLLQKYIFILKKCNKIYNIIINFCSEESYKRRRMQWKM